MESVTVIVDASTPAVHQSALRWAIERAHSLDVTINLVSVAPRAGEPGDERTSETVAPFARAVEEAERVVKSAVPGTAVTTSVRRGSPPHALLAISRATDLLVVESHHTGPIAGIIHGTLALQVAGRAECPTVVVPREWFPGKRGVVVGWTDDVTADVALEFAAREAVREGCPLTIVHGWVLPAGAEASYVTGTLLAPSMIQALRDLVDAAAVRTRATYPTLQVDVVFEPGPGAVILVQAARGSALTVVGSHGRGALGGLILGSVSHDVLMNMPGPVIVVPPPGEPITVLPEIVEEDLI